MLQLKQIHKQYKTGELVQTALDSVSLNLRDNEFVAILGPSGSGKTTLLNIIGGLDRYDSGDLIINGISTREYTDRDWDSYRNHTIGFVFQSYNLIPASDGAGQCGVGAHHLRRVQGGAPPQGPGCAGAGGIGKPDAIKSPVRCPAARCSGWPSPGRW